MKTIFLFLMSLALLGCESSNDLGKCIGINDEEKPGLIYKVSARNIVVGVIFFELVAPPIFVVLDQWKCPVERR